MADNVSVRDAAALTFNAATDELSDTSQSPKVTMLAGDGSPTPIDPRRLTGLPGSDYETVAASQTDQVLGATGATGDLINGILVIPASTSPGAITLKDGATAILVFTGGASSVSNLVPFLIPLSIRSVGGAWSLTTGANVSCLAVGDFSLMWQLQPGVLSRAALDAVGNLLGIGGTPVTTANEDVAYAGFTVVAVGGTPAYTYSVASGALPAGITLNSSSGVVSGTPTTPGTYAGIVIRATDAVSATADLAPFTITVARSDHAMLPDVFINSFGTPRQANANGVMVNL